MLLRHWLILEHDMPNRALWAISKKASYLSADKVKTNFLLQGVREEPVRKGKRTGT